METAFGILLFVLIYGPIAYMVYAELKGRRSRLGPRPAAIARREHRTGLQPASR
jgi:hypothetical protein